MQIEKKYCKFLLVGEIVFLLLLVPSFSQTLGQWTVINHLNVARSANNIVTANNNVYTLGGWPYTNTPYPVEYCTILSNGYLTPWIIDTIHLMNQAHDEGEFVASDKYIYAMGGENSTDILTTIERTAINSDGSLSAWTTIGVTTTMIGDEGALVQYHSFIYAIGGSQGSPNNFTRTGSNIYRTNINPDGSLGTWTLLSSMLNIGRFDHSAILINTTLYVVDGESISGITDSVERAFINSDGTLSTFTIINYTTVGHTSADIVYDGKYLYIIGGATNSAYNAERALVNPDGSLGTWIISPQFNFQISDGGGGYVQTTTAAYSVGGSNGSDLTSVEYAPIIYPLPTGINKRDWELFK